MACNKSPYTKKQAQSVLNKLMREGTWSHKEPGRIYPCDVCNSWHITHNEFDAGYNLTIPTRLKHLDRWQHLIQNQT